MEAIAVKIKFHQLIDKVENNELLEKLYNTFKEVTDSKLESWKTLSLLNKKHILDSYEESLNDENLLSNETVKAKYNKWLTQ